MTKLTKKYFDKLHNLIDKKENDYMEALKVLKGRIEKLEKDIKSTKGVVDMLEKALSKRKATLGVLQMEKQEISKAVKYFEN